MGEGIRYGCYEHIHHYFTEAAFWYKLQEKASAWMSLQWAAAEDVSNAASVGWW